MEWKQPRIAMPDNYSMCLRRLVSLEIKMRKLPEFRKSYIEKIQDYITKGYAKKLTTAEINEMRATGDCWFLPHFGTSTINKPK